jgi:hypothetical protein
MTVSIITGIDPKKNNSSDDGYMRTMKERGDYEEALNGKSQEASEYQKMYCQMINQMIKDPRYTIDKIDSIDNSDDVSKIIVTINKHRGI